MGEVPVLYYVVGGFVWIWELWRYAYSCYIMTIVQYGTAVNGPVYSINYHTRRLQNAGVYR